MNLNLPLILFITFKVIVSPNKLSSSAQPKYVTWVLLGFDVTIFYVQFSYFSFSIFGGEKNRTSFMLPKLNTQFVIYKSVTYIGQVFCEFVFRSLQIFILKWQICIICIGKKITIYSDISLICNRNDKGPRMNLCETLKRGSAEVENLSWTLTWNFLLSRYDLY